MAGGAGTKVQLWDLANGTELATLDASGSINNLAFLPSGQGMVVTLNSAKIQLWTPASDVATSKP
jgi:WD40 repeat protein